MARSKGSKIELTAYDDLFETDESRAEANLSKIREIPIVEIDEFPDHPFKVLMDEDMEQLVDSVRRSGVMTPATVRQKEDGRYELISGHRRKKACELAGLETLKCEVKELTRDEAIIVMVESNLQRTTILPSEKAFAYKMRLEAMNRQGERTDLTFFPVESPTEYASAKVETAEEWAVGKAASVFSVIARGMAKKSYEKIRERNRGQALTEGIESAGEPAHPSVSGKSSMPGDSSMPKQPPAQGTGNAGMERLKKNRAKEQISSGQKIRMKTDRKAGLHASSSRSVKTAPRIVNTKFPDSSSKQIWAGMGAAQRWQKLHTETAAKRMAVNSAKAAQAGAKQGVYYGNKAVRETARGISAAVRAMGSAVKSLQALMAGGIGIAVFFVIMIGVIGGILCNNSSQSTEPLSPEVLNYTPIIQRYAQEYGIPEYVQVIQAIMMQESGGQGTDPMQASECPYNTQYPNSPGGITDLEYSIKVGIQNYADCVRQAGCTSPQDLDKLKLSLQGYNYGNGYIGWAIRNYGGYSEANALRFSQEQAAAHGWSGYGDPEYVPHVLRYYSGGNLFAGLFGSSQMVSVAMTQLGNEGGQKYWSWYGFGNREEWCACFVSYV